MIAIVIAYDRRPVQSPPAVWRTQLTRCRAQRTFVGNQHGRRQSHLSREPSQSGAISVGSTAMRGLSELYLICYPLMTWFLFQLIGRSACVIIDFACVCHFACVCDLPPHPDGHPHGKPVDRICRTAALGSNLRSGPGPTRTLAREVSREFARKPGKLSTARQATFAAGKRVNTPHAWPAGGSPFAKCSLMKNAA